MSLSQSKINVRLKSRRQGRLKFERGRKYLAPGLFGPCYGFPAIIGAKIGNREPPCVGFAGDGAFGISIREMSSIGREEWPGVTVVVFRNFQ